MLKIFETLSGFTSKNRDHLQGWGGFFCNSIPIIYENIMPMLFFKKKYIQGDNWVNYVCLRI